MTFNLENPFRNPAKRATKRLFGGGQENIKKKIKAKLEQVRIKYGPFELLPTQVAFLRRLEKLIPQEVLDKKERLYKKHEVLAQKKLISRIKKVEKGMIISIDLDRLNLPELPELPKSLQDLECRYNKLHNLPKLPVSLQGLICYNNKLNELPQLPDSLKRLHCGDNPLKVLPNLPASLEYFNCEGDQLTNLPKLPLALEELICSRNQLTALPDLPNSIIQLCCETNQIKTLPHLPESLISVYCRGNRLTAETIAQIHAHKNYNYSMFVY